MPEDEIRHISSKLNIPLQKDRKILRASQNGDAQFHQLFKQHNAIMLLIDPHARLVVDANAAAARFYGYPLDTLIGMSVEKINAKSESEMHSQRQLVLEGKCNQFYVDHRLANGDIRTVEVLTSTISLNETIFFFSIIHDVTEKIEAEKKLRVSESLYRKLTESMKDIIWVMDVETLRYVYVSQSVFNMLGYTPKEFIAKAPDTELSSERQQVRTLILERAEQFKHGLISSETFFAYELELARKDGSLVWAELIIYHDVNEYTGGVELHGVTRDISERVRVQQELEGRAHIDFLTGADNRGYFMQKAEKELARALRYRSALSLLMMDIDFFKQVNDSHGHAVGDEALKMLTEICRRTLREIDIIGRIGGEEFAILLPQTDRNAATEVAERLRIAIANECVLSDGDALIQIKVSIGVSSLGVANTADYPDTRPDVVKLDELTRLADKALYEAKKTGRNKVCVATQDNDV